MNEPTNGQGIFDVLFVIIAIMVIGAMWPWALVGILWSAIVWTYGKRRP